MPGTVYPFFCKSGTAARIGAAPIEWPMSWGVSGARQGQSDDDDV
jgi:hypothetical protein